jgi:hypothetical protein
MDGLVWCGSSVEEGESMFPITRWVKAKVPFLVRLFLAWMVWLIAAKIVAALLRAGYF